MTELSLPASVDFSKRLPALSDDVRTDLLTIQANNGQSFTSGNVVNFDLPSRDGLFLQPSSMFIRYKVNYTVATAPVVVRGIPAAAHIAKLDEYVGSQPINSVYAWNQAATAWINTNMSIADKYGMQSALGLSPLIGTPTLDQMDSRTISTGTGSYTVAIPLLCSAFQSADHLIPTGLMPAGRVQLTIASPTEFLTAAPANMTAYTITNCELCVAGVNLGVAVQNMVASMGPRLYLRCNGWASASQSVPSGSSGVQSLPFNHRYKSIENIFMLFSGTNAAIDVNAWADSRDITGTAGGSYQVVVGSQQFPLLPIDTAANKAGALQYLREATGSIADFRNSMSINTVEFGYLGDSATVTTAVEPAKFIIGIPMNRVQSDDPYKHSSLLSGVDCASTPLLATIRIGSPTAQGFNATMLAQYTVLVEIDPITRQVNIVQ